MAPPNEGAGNENGILAAENQPGHGIVAASTDEPVAPLDSVHPVSTNLLDERLYQNCP